MGIMESLRKQGVRIYGPSPPKGAPKVESLIFVRRIYTRLLPFTLPLWIGLALNHSPAWLWVVLSVSAATWLLGFISVSLQIRRHRNRSADG